MDILCFSFWGMESFINRTRHTIKPGTPEHGTTEHGTPAEHWRDTGTRNYGTRNTSGTLAGHRNTAKQSEYHTELWNMRRAVE